MTTEPTPSEALAAAMAALGLTIDAEFVPYSRSRHAKGAKPWLSLNWVVTLKRDGRDVLATDYSAGSAHAPAATASAGALRLDHARTSPQVARQELVAAECEHGRALRYFPGGSMTNPQRGLIQPDPCDVMHSLISDSDVLDYASFESWASEFGYDADSRTAEATYRACLALALALRTAIGDAGLEALRTAGEGY